MNDNTRSVYALARIHEYLSDLVDIVNESNRDIDRILSNKTTKYAVNMCIHQIGEQAKNIRDHNRELYDNKILVLHQIKGVRDKIAHTYDNIDYNVIKYILESYTPFLKKCIESLIDKEILDNPYCLFDKEAEMLDLSKLEELNITESTPEVYYEGYRANLYVGEEIVIYDPSDKEIDSITDPDVVDRINNADDLQDYLEEYVKNLNRDYDDLGR